jgi:hypothetical protein
MYFSDRLRVFENGVLRRVFGPKRHEVTGNGEDYITRSFMLCILIKYKMMILAGHVARMGGQER